MELSKEKRAWTLDLLIPVPDSVWRGFLVWFQQHVLRQMDRWIFGGFPRKHVPALFPVLSRAESPSLSAYIKAEQVAARTGENLIC